MEMLSVCLKRTEQNETPDETAEKNKHTHTHEHTIYKHTIYNSGIDKAHDEEKT